MNAALTRPEFLLLLFVLIFSPLAFGTVEPWSLAIAQSAVLAGLAIALHRRTRAGSLHLCATPGALPLLLFLGFLLLQVTPLPPALVLLLSPAAHERWSAALGGDGPLPWLTISLDPNTTLRELVRFSACGALYVLTVQLLARRERLHAVAVALPIFAAALAFEAIVQFLVAPLRLLFIRPAPWQFPFGPFVNRNHYANLMAMLTPVVFGLFLGRSPRAGSRSLRERCVDLLARRESSVRLLVAFAALLSAASLVISLSRGGTIAVVAALLVFGGFLIAHRLGRRRTVAAALFWGVFTVFVGWFGWEKVADRFTELRTNPDLVDTVRAGLWRDTLRMSADFPLLGAGVGSFDRLYPAYRSVPGTQTIAHAHNDYLELLAGGGVFGLVLFSWFSVAVLLASARACNARQSSSSRYLAFGSLAGCVAFLIHGGSDFSLAIGANALYFFFLLGLAVSASHASGAETAAESHLARRRLPAFFARFAAALAVIVTLAGAADLTARHAWKLAGEEGRRSDAQAVTPAGVIRLVDLASRFQPLDAAYPAARSRIAFRDGKSEEALRFTRSALRRLPLDAASLMQLGTLLASRGDAGSARRGFAAAVAADPASAPNRERFGAWLLSRGDRVAGLAQLREALALDPERARGVFGMLVLAGFDDARIAASLPSTPAVLLQFARYARETGAAGLAVEAYERVLAIVPGNPEAVAGLHSLSQPR